MALLTTFSGRGRILIAPLQVRCRGFREGTEEVYLNAAACIRGYHLYGEDGQAWIVFSGASEVKGRGDMIKVLRLGRVKGLFPFPIVEMSV